MKYVISDADVSWLTFPTKSRLEVMRQLEIRWNLKKYMLPWLSLYFPKYGMLNHHVQASSFKADTTLSFKSLKIGVYKRNFDRPWTTAPHNSFIMQPDCYWFKAAMYST